MNTVAKLVVGMLFCMVCLLPMYNACASDTINSLEVVKNTLKGLTHCLDYRIVGLCFWLRCSPMGCHIETTLKVVHYLPDGVVSSYTKPDNNPWWFAQHVEDPVFDHLQGIIHLGNSKVLADLGVRRLIQHAFTFHYYRFGDYILNHVLVVFTAFGALR